jgi:hypothetical protein
MYNMFDLYLFNTIINTIWYIFTILFVLYKFTSFFSYIYNFVRFCGKLFNGGYYLYDQIRIYLRKRRGYTNLSSNDVEAQDTEYLLPNQNVQHKTLFQTCKDYVTNQYDYYYFKIFGKRRNTFTEHKKNDVNIQLTETSFTNSESYSKEKIYERNLFDRQLSELCENNSSIEFNDYIEQHKQLRRSMEDTMFHSVELNNNGSSSFTNYLFGSRETNETKPYDVLNSNLLFDSQFITNQSKNNERVNVKNQSIQTPIFPPPDENQDNPSNLVKLNPKHVSKRKIDTILEEDEINDRVVFKVNSLWKEPEPEPADKRLDISQSLIDDKSSSVDYEYRNEILRNPYI